MNTDHSMISGRFLLAHDDQKYIPGNPKIFENNFNNDSRRVSSAIDESKRLIPIAAETIMLNKSATKCNMENASILLIVGFIWPHNAANTGGKAQL